MTPKEWLTLIEQVEKDSKGSTIGQDLLRKYAHLLPTADCLQPHELKEHAILSEERMRHIKTCEFCQVLLPEIHPAAAKPSD